MDFSIVFHLVHTTYSTRHKTGRREDLFRDPGAAMNGSAFSSGDHHDDGHSWVLET
jgi:hypothetical protein